MKYQIAKFLEKYKKRRQTLSHALEGYKLHAEARRLSMNTISDYFVTFTKFQDFLGDDLPLIQITTHQVEQFLALAGKKVSKKTTLNYHIALSALWTWALAEGLVSEHIIRRVKPPKPEKIVIIPFTKQDVELMLVACEKSRPYRRVGQRRCNHELPNRERNKAIILTLLDTGLRASELCNTKIADTDLRNKRITVMGKGDKKRPVPLSNRTIQIIQRYQATRSDLIDEYPLFAGRGNSLHFSRSGLRQLINRIGQRAGVKNATPHLFRHTFAINFLRNGGNIYVLQELLGHATLDMVKRYLKLAERDAVDLHRIASPVSNWDL